MNRRDLAKALGFAPAIGGCVSLASPPQYFAGEVLLPVYEDFLGPEFKSPVPVRVVAYGRLRRVEPGAVIVSEALPDIILARSDDVQPRC